MHKPKTPLNRAMVQTAQNTIHDSDILLMLIPADSDIHPHDLFLIENLAQIKVPVFLVINKIDLIEKKYLLPLIDKFRALYDYRDIFPVSALKRHGIDDLLEAIKKILPEGPMYYPDDIVTDATERFIAAEFIRAKILLLTKQEVPYSSVVVVDLFKEDEVKNLIRISATINMEKESQKAIIIGKKGVTLKKIGTAARFEMEKFYNAKIFLELYVRVKKNWTSSDKMLKEFGLLTR
jgi:GTP-binding protein Era